MIPRRTGHFCLLNECDREYGCSVTIKVIYCLPTANCGENFNGTEGSFHSPNYPGRYGNLRCCTWLITVPENHHVELKFRSFEVSILLTFGVLKVFLYFNLTNGNNDFNYNGNNNLKGTYILLVV